MHIAQAAEGPKLWEGEGRVEIDANFVGGNCAPAPLFPTPLHRIKKSNHGKWDKRQSAPHLAFLE